MSQRPKRTTPEEHRAQRARYHRLVRSTTAAINAGIDACDRGLSGAQTTAAMRAASEAANAPKAGRGGRAPSAMPVPALPRLSGPGWTADKQREFLVLLSETGCVRQSCERIGLTRQSAYALRRRAPNSMFSAGWDVAIHLARQKLLDEATERALTGHEAEVWYHGEKVGTRTVHNDKLLMFLLGLKREPLHPVLDAREMACLFPTMLANVDTILPSPFTPERIAELKGEEEE